MATSRCHLARTYCSPTVSLCHFLTGACDGWCDMTWCHRCHGVEASVVQPTMSLENIHKNVRKWTGFSALEYYSPICLRTLTDCLSLFTWRPGTSQRRCSQCKFSLVLSNTHTTFSKLVTKDRWMLVAAFQWFPRGKSLLQYITDNNNCLTDGLYFYTW